MYGVYYVFTTLDYKSNVTIVPERSTIQLKMFIEGF